MTITMKRKVESEMMATYFPSLLLIMITYATTFFNVTTMLPPMSATKMIDFWLILCHLVPFAQVVLLTASELLREDEQEHVLEKETSQETKPINDNPKARTHFKIEYEGKAKEQCTSMLNKISKASYLKMLAVICEYNHLKSPKDSQTNFSFDQR